MKRYLVPSGKGDFWGSSSSGCRGVLEVTPTICPVQSPRVTVREFEGRRERTPSPRSFWGRLIFRIQLEWEQLTVPRKKSGSKGDASSQKSSRRLQADNINSKFDAESVATRGSILSARTNQRQRPSPSSGRSKPMKNFLLPREMDNLLREFRQKHSNPAMLATDANNIKDKYEDDDSTIASAMSLDDDAIYKECLKDDEVKDALFSGSLFAAIATMERWT
eukprot:g14180.t1 g14180   contig9:1344336-1344998(-)